MDGPDPLRERHLFRETNRTDFADVNTGYLSNAEAAGAYRSTIVAGRLLGNETAAWAGDLQVDFKPPRTLPWAISGGSSYTLETGAGFSVTPSIAIRYMSAHQSGTNNITFYRAASGTVNFTGSGEKISGSLADARWLVNMNLAMITDDGLWRLGVECDNCFNEVYPASAINGYSYLNTPRTWMVTLQRRFRAGIPSLPVVACCAPGPSGSGDFLCGPP